MEHLDLEAMAKAIEADAGQPIDGLMDSLKEMQIGAGKVYTSETESLTALIPLGI
jgi:putative transcriptional regulator